MRRLLSLFAFAAFMIATVNPALAASYKKLYTFTGSLDGGNPSGGLVRDSDGNLYGTTKYGGKYSHGVVFELTQTPGGKWKESVLYNFCPALYCLDGAFPTGGLVMDSAGNLYGTTFNGGVSLEASGGAGALYELIRTGGTWNEIVLHNFCTAAVYCADGQNPNSGLILDGAGNMYGTTLHGGVGAGDSAGVVFEVSAGNGGWTETVLWPFCQVRGCPDGANPQGGVAFDSAGNLYGTAGDGTSDYHNCFNLSFDGCGIVFELSPTKSGYWQYAPLYDFCPVSGCLDGEIPLGGVTLDSLGNVYGTADYGGTKSGGVIFALTPATGAWQYGVLRDFCSKRSSKRNCTDGTNPATTMIFDSAGNLYGTTQADGAGAGGVAFKLTPVLGGWQETILHNFCTKQLCPDGSQPSALIFDPRGNLFGTTLQGGLGLTGGGPGVVFEITQ